jgi:hypothetical protein
LIRDRRGAKKKSSPQARWGMCNRRVGPEAARLACLAGEVDKAADELARGYMLGGPELFDGEEPKYPIFLIRADPNVVLAPLLQTRRRGHRPR